jgi:CHC2 zinc finger
MTEEKKRWVDFAAVKAAVSMQRALSEHYGIAGETSGWHSGWQLKDGELRGPCPLPECKGKRSFSVNVSKNTFHCFVCKARGNVLDFVAKMEDCTIRGAALKLAEWFKVGESEAETIDEALAEPAPPANKNIVGVARVYLSEGVGHSLMLFTLGDAFERAGFSPGDPFEVEYAPGKITLVKVEDSS